MEQTALSNVVPSNTGTTLDTANQLGTRVPDQDQIMLLSIICIDTQKHAGDIQQRDRLDDENWSSWLVFQGPVWSSFWTRNSLTATATSCHN
jgi:hypothetical protein